MLGLFQHNLEPFLCISDKIPAVSSDENNWSFVRSAEQATQSDFQNNWGAGMKGSPQKPTPGVPSTLKSIN